MPVVFQYVKDTIWKQITTKPPVYRLPVRLFFNTSKIQFESKSQLGRLHVCSQSRCFSIRQRYNLKANHNNSRRRFQCCIVVFQYVKDTIWKQITTGWDWRQGTYELFFNTSKIQFESKSQQRADKSYLRTRCFSIRQRYNLKANHNYREDLRLCLLVVFQYVKDTIWKQITTEESVTEYFFKLFFNTSKIQFESKSQRSMAALCSGFSCFSIRQRYNLKANHN